MYRKVSRVVHLNVYLYIPSRTGFSSCIMIIRFSPISDERILYSKIFGLPDASFSTSNIAHNTLEVSFFV